MANAVRHGLLVSYASFKKVSIDSITDRSGPSVGLKAVLYPQLVAEPREGAPRERGTDPTFVNDK